MYVAVYVCTYYAACICKSKDNMKWLCVCVCVIDARANVAFGLPTVDNPV